MNTDWKEFSKFNEFECRYYWLRYSDGRRILSMCFPREVVKFCRYDIGCELDTTDVTHIVEAETPAIKTFDWKQYDHSSLKDGHYWVLRDAKDFLLGKFQNGSLSYPDTYRPCVVDHIIGIVEAELPN